MYESHGTIRTVHTTHAAALKTSVVSVADPMRNVSCMLRPGGTGLSELRLRRTVRQAAHTLNNPPSIVYWSFIVRE